MLRMPLDTYKYHASVNLFCCQQIISEVDHMEPSKPPDISGMKVAGLPALGRGLQLETVLGRSRGLPLAAETPSVGRARGVFTPGETVPGPALSLPTTVPVQGRGVLAQPESLVFGRARGVLLQKVEPKVGVARGSVLSSLQLQDEGASPPETLLIPSGDTTALTTGVVSLWIFEHCLCEEHHCLVQGSAAFKKSHSS